MTAKCDRSDQIALLIEYIRQLYSGKEFIPLQEPAFVGNEKTYLSECIDSTYVSSVGPFVNEFEKKVAEYIGVRYAVATVNGTSALQVALKIVGVEQNDEVITQPLSFVATCNAISYCAASPVFVDVDIDTMGMSPNSLMNFLEMNTLQKNGVCYNKNTGKKISAIVPMHTFGHPCRIQEITHIAKNYNIPVVEDAAESLGSFVSDIHTGTFGIVSALSFNGNKIITTGGGGMILTNDEYLAEQARHITTTAKTPHKYEFYHDQIGYNYRLPNINAALGCAQMESLHSILEGKKNVTKLYDEFLSKTDIRFFKSLANCKSNNWLNAVILNNRKERDYFLKLTNENNVMTRPIWTLMTHLPMYKDCQHMPLTNALWLEDTVVNIPSSVC